MRYFTKLDEQVFFFFRLLENSSIETILINKGCSALQRWSCKPADETKFASFFSLFFNSFKTSSWVPSYDLHIQICIFLLLSTCCLQVMDRTWQPLATASQTPASQRPRMGVRQHSQRLLLSLPPLHSAEGRTTMYRDSIHIDADLHLWAAV